MLVNSFSLIHTSYQSLTVTKQKLALVLIVKANCSVGNGQHILLTACRRVRNEMRGNYRCKIAVGLFLVKSLTKHTRVVYYFSSFQPPVKNLLRIHVIMTS